MSLGRKTDLTAQVQEAICEALRRGHYLTTAAQAGGVHRGTVYRWLERASTGEEPYASFSDAVKIAEAQGEMALVEIVRTAAVADPKNWTAAMTILERRHRDRYGRGERNLQDPAGEEDLPSDPVELRKMIAEELKRTEE